MMRESVFDERLHAQDIDGELRVVVLSDQFEGVVTESLKREEIFERSHLERDVLREVVGIQVVYAVMVVALDVDLQVERGPVLFQQIPKPAALDRYGVMRQAVARRDVAVERVPFALLIADPELRDLSPGTYRRIHDFQLSCANGFIEPCAR